MKSGQKLIRGLLIGLAAAAIALTLRYFGTLQRWEFATWNWRSRLFARPSEATENIRLILLDQKSLEWGRENDLSWPWPREVYAPIIDFCRRGGARVVAFDVLYTEPSVYGVGDDEVLGAAIKSPPPFVGALALTRKEAGRKDLNYDFSRRWAIRNGLELWLNRKEARNNLVYPRAISPIPEVEQNAVLLGNVIDAPDPDSIFRRASLFNVFDATAVPSLGLAAWLAGRKDFPGSVAEMDSGGIFFGLEPGEERKYVPLDPSGRAILRYRGPSEVYRPVSAAAVIQSELRIRSGEEPSLPADTFRDSYVLFGFSAPGLLDLRATPLSPVAPGVTIHATVLDNLLGGDFVREVGEAVFLGASFLLAAGGAGAVLFCRKAWQSVIVFLIFLPLPWIAGFGLYLSGLWWPIIADELAVMIALIGAIVVNYSTEGRQKAFIKNAFKYYLSSAVIEKLIADPSQLQLGGERRELSIFFSDLQGFSGISERLNPSELTALLNEYLSDMTDIILQEGGTLDKYEGDAILAFWNAPLTQGNHAVRACRAALKCQDKLRQRREEFRRRTGAELFMRIGINTGEVVVGNMGSRDRFDYTVLGDAANLASRLEGANKAFGTYLMVSESTWQQAGGEFTGRALGKIRVVGRKTPVRVFEPLAGTADKTGLDPKEFERGVELCYSRDWSAALSVFEKFPDEPAARVYAERCRELIENPQEDWDGIWNLTQK